MDEAARGLRRAHWLGLVWSPVLEQTVTVIRQPVFVNGIFVGALGAGIAISKLSRFVAGFGSETFILRGTDGVVAHSALVGGFDGEVWRFVYRTVRAYKPEPWVIGNHSRQSDLGREFRRLTWAGAVGLGVVALDVPATFLIGHFTGNFEFDGIKTLGPCRLRELDEAAGAFNPILRGLLWFETYVLRGLQAGTPPG